MLFVPTPAFLRPTLVVSISLAALAPFSLAFPANAQPPKPATPAAISAAPAPILVQKTLPSGLRLVVQTKPGAELVALAVSVRAGTGSETAQNSGVAHLIEHMVFKGTISGKPGQLDAQMENLGGELTARTSRDQTLYTATVPQNNWQKALPVLADMLTHPAFRKNDLEAERRVIAREAAASLTEPARTGFAQLAGEAYPPDSPYHFPLMGQAQTLASLTPDAMRAFWQKNYAPNNLTLVVVGDVAPAEAEAMANQLFPPASQTPPDAPAENNASPEPAAPTETTETLVIAPPTHGVHQARALPASQTPQRELTTVFLGFFVPPAGDTGSTPETAKRDAALAVLARYLARNGAGQLEKTLVQERKQALSADADYVQNKHGGLLFVSAIFAPNEAEKAEKYVADALQRFNEDDIDNADIQAAKSILLGEMRYQNETVEDTAKFLAQNDLLHPQTLTLDANASAIEAVTTSDVKSVLRQFLTPARYAVAFVGPTKASPPEGSAF